MKKVLPFLCLVLVAACRSEQDVEPANEPTFLRFYGSEHNHTAHLALEADNGFTMVSTVQIAKDNLGKFVYKIRLIHTDQFGNELWNKEFPSFEDEIIQDEITGENVYDIGSKGSFKASSFIVLNTGYLIVGERINTRTNGTEYSELLLIETDFNGNSSEDQVRTLKLNGPSLHGRAVTMDGSGNFYVLANITESTTVEDMFLAKLSGSSYDSLWSRQYGDGASEVISRLLFNTNQNILWGCTVKFGNQADNDIRLLETSDDSQTANRPMQFRVDTFNETIKDLTEAPGGYFVVGTTDENDIEGGSSGNNIYVFKSSSDGRLLNKVILDFSDQNDIGNSICEGVNGGALVLATVQSGSARGNGKEDLYLYKLNALFEPEWEITYGGLDKETGASVCKTSDGGYLIYGMTYFGSLQKLMLMKVRSDGTL